MLIPSPRHRPEDLSLWRETELADRAHARHDGFRRKVERALKAVEEFAGAGPCYASVSWGKDSVVLAHLCWLAGESGGPGVPLYYARPVPSENPDSAAVEEFFLRRWPGVAYAHVDAPGAFAEAFREICRLAGTARRLTGVRSEESGVRKIRCRQWGEASPNTCAPLAWWTSADVFAYHAVYGLPTHPAYAMLGGGRWERRHVRVDELGGVRGDQFGRREWEWEYYGDVLRRLGAAERGTT